MTAAVPTRRRVLAGGAAVLGGGAVTQVGGAGAAAAATTYAARPWTATPVPHWRQRHFMNRMGCGYSRTTFQQLLSAGGARPWFEKQLVPSKVVESATATALPGWF